MRGGAVGLLYADGRIAEADLVQYLHGHLHSSREGGEDGPTSCRGLLSRPAARCGSYPASSPRSTTCSTSGTTTASSGSCRCCGWHWRTSRRARRTGWRSASPRCWGRQSLNVATLPDIGSGEMLRAVEINRAVRASLAADGLEVFCE